MLSWTWLLTPSKSKEIRGKGSLIVAQKERPDSLFRSLFSSHERRFITKKDRAVRDFSTLSLTQN